MKAANKISFKIQDNGNGYGHFFGEFEKDGEKVFEEVGMVCLCADENIVATIISIIGQYKPLELTTETEMLQVKLLMTESEMRNAESRFRDLQKKQSEMTTEKEQEKK